MTAFGTKSMTRPSLSRPRHDEHAPATSASAADRAANVTASPSASGPTAAAESADVAVVALTTSERDVPRSAYASRAPGAAASPADGGKSGDLRVGARLRNDHAPDDQARR